MDNLWKKCSVCKNDIGFDTIYHKCSVSTCKKSVFCSVRCHDVHLSVMNHKSAWAEEEVAPKKMEIEDVPRRILVTSKKESSKGSSYKDNKDFPKDILVVVSKLKNYVKLKHDMNTSANVMDRLSDIMRVLCDDATECARAEGRKTLMDRDFR